MTTRSLAAAALLFAQTAAVNSAEPERIGSPPPEAFWRTPNIRGAVVSPDGQHVAYIANIQDKPVITVLDLATGLTTALARGENISAIQWKGNNRLLSGEEHASPAMMDINTHAITLLSALDKSVADGVIFDFLVGDSEQIIISCRDRLSLYNLATGKREDLYVEKGDRIYYGAKLTRNYCLDRHGTIRARLLREKDRNHLQVRDASGKKFITIKSWDLPATPWVPVGFSGENNDQLLVVTHDQSDLGDLQNYDLRTGTLSPALPVQSPYALRGPIFSPDRQKLLGQFVDGPQPFVRWTDPEMAKLQSKLDGTFAGKTAHIARYSNDLQVLIVGVSSSSEPITWYVLDQRKPSLNLLAKEPSPLPVDRMAETEVVEIKARDGLMIHGFLTRPKVTPGSKPPLILIPFPMPFEGRFDGNYSEAAQFLASRGYLVLRLNYRGTGGYGTKYMLAGRGEIAGRMIDDILDASIWAVDSGLCRAGDICLYGEELAGGMALVAAAERPDLFGAVINQSGITGWRRYSEQWSDSPYAAWYAINTKAVLNRSPLSTLAGLRAPLLQIYDSPGDLDEELERKLKAGEKAFVVADFYQGDIKPHVFVHTNARSIDAFLAKNLPPNKPGGK